MSERNMSHRRILNNLQSSSAFKEVKHNSHLKYEAHTMTFPEGTQRESNRNMTVQKLKSSSSLLTKFTSTGMAWSKRIPSMRVVLDLL